jgi:hypothetical protein
MPAAASRPTGRSRRPPQTAPAPPPGKGREGVLASNSAEGRPAARRRHRSAAMPAAAFRPTGRSRRPPQTAPAPPPGRGREAVLASKRAAGRPAAPRRQRSSAMPAEASRPTGAPHAAREERLPSPCQEEGQGRGGSPPEPRVLRRPAGDSDLRRCPPQRPHLPPAPHAAGKERLPPRGRRSDGYSAPFSRAAGRPAARRRHDLRETRRSIPTHRPLPTPPVKNASPPPWEGQRQGTSSPPAERQVSGVLASCHGREEAPLEMSGWHADPRIGCPAECPVAAPPRAVSLLDDALRLQRAGPEEI